MPSPDAHDHYRQGLDRIEAGEFAADRREAMQAGLDQAIEKAAQLAVEGNGYLRQVAENDGDLQRAIGQVGRPTGVPPSTADVTAEQERDLRGEEEDRRPPDNDAREAHDLAAAVEATNRLQDRLNKDRETAQRSGETTRTDPAQQHIPRLEELEREQIEQKERDRDDRDR